MNLAEFRGGKHHIDQDLLQLLYEDHPCLRASPSSSGGNLSNFSFKDWETRPAINEEDTVGDVEVQEVEDQGEVRPTTPSDAEGNEEEGVAQVLPFSGYNDDGEPVSEAGDVLEGGQDYVVEEYTEARPLRRNIDRWISPPSVMTMKKLTNLFEHDLLGNVECFLPSLGQLATNPEEGYCPWSRAHTKQGLMLPFLPYFKKMANYYHISLTQFTPKGLKYMSALFRTLCLIRMGKRAQKILQLSFDEWNISLRAMTPNFLKYKFYPVDFFPKAEEAVEEVVPRQEALSKKKKKRKAPPSNQVPIERSIRIRDGPKRVAQPSAPVAGKGKIILVEQEQEDSLDDNAPSLLDRENAPAYTQAMSQKVLPLGRKGRVMAPARYLSVGGGPIGQEDLKISGGSYRVQGHKKGGGGSTDGSRLSQHSSTFVALNPEAKNGKGMLQFYQVWVLPELIMKMAYTYSQAKSSALKTITTTTKWEVDDAKKEAEEKSVNLGEVNKKLLAANKRVEEL
uniref:Uncharacterized protein n=1 Tax=Cannabis sativa TaxID=3483 RepID=A0A803QDJ0_CANSA